MAIQILSPRFSFVRFCETEDHNTCNPLDVVFNIPVYQFDDVYFQFVAVADTAAEADALCDIDNDLIEIGLVADCNQSGFTLDFAPLKPERFRIGERSVLYNWSHGLPDFDTEFAVRECFHIRVIINHPTAGTVTCCSNKFERIAEDCYTSVIDYGSEQNIYGFNYCGGGIEEDDDSPCAEPTIQQFVDLATLTIPYTAAMQANYGVIPTVEVYIWDGTQYIKPVISIGFDAYPPTEIVLDFGGTATGFVKIS